MCYSWAGGTKHRATEKSLEISNHSLSLSPPYSSSALREGPITGLFNKQRAHLRSPSLAIAQLSAPLIAGLPMPDSQLACPSRHRMKRDVSPHKLLTHFAEAAVEVRDNVKLCKTSKTKQHYASGNL